MPKRSIVLIDDNAVELKLSQIALKDAKISRPLISFTDPAKAYNYINEDRNNVFIVICDIKMPGMTGLDLLEKVNCDKTLKLQTIPFVFLSNSNTPKDIEEAYNLAAQGYFVKPFIVDDLEDMFKTIVAYWNMAKTPQLAYHMS